MPNQLLKSKTFDDRDKKEVRIRIATRKSIANRKKRETKKLNDTSVPFDLAQDALFQFTLNDDTQNKLIEP